MSSVEKILEERGNRYGVFSEHARITQNIKRAMYDSPKFADLADDQVEALEMIAHKIGRILNGDPNYADSWVDIAGYSKLVADRLETATQTFGPLDQVYTIEEINEMIDLLDAADAASKSPMTQEEETEYRAELTYAAHCKAKGVELANVDDQAINRAHVESDPHRCNGFNATGARRCQQFERCARSSKNKTEGLMGTFFDVVGLRPNCGNFVDVETVA